MSKFDKSNNDIEMMMILATLGSRLCENVIKDAELKFGAKKIFQDIKRSFLRCNEIIRTTTGKEISEAIDKKIVENYDNGSVLNILHYVGKMDDVAREEFEKELEKIFN